MPLKPLNPMHDAGGSLWPECDWRPVTAGVMQAYLGCSKDTLSRWTRDRRSLGFGRGEGVRMVRKNDRSRGHYEYVPGLIWQRLRRGRYQDPRFDWRDVSIPIYVCAVADTLARTYAGAPVAAQIPAGASAELVAACAVLVRALTPGAGAAPSSLAVPTHEAAHA